MNKTGKGIDGSISTKKLAVTTDELMAMLSCGRQTAVKIGEDSYARIQVGRRVLWSVERVQEYLRELAS